MLAVGDTTIDAFIRLKDARVNCDVNDEHCRICLNFADKVPYESVTIVPAVGNAANAGVAAARLGLSSGFVGYVGADLNGELCVRTLSNEGVSTKYVTKEAGSRTNYHYVLWYEDERTILVKHEEFSYRFPNVRHPPVWLYLSSLGEHSLPYHHEIVAYLDLHKEVKLAFQPGTFQIKMGYVALRDIYARTDIFFCNKEEAQRILGTQESGMKKLLKRMRVLGPKTVVITDGRYGAWSLGEEGSFRVPMYPDPKAPLERTGAGDAFSSTVVVALALGRKMKEALAWGPVNAMAVVQEIGGQKGLLTKKVLLELLKKAPPKYKVQTF